MSTTNYLGLNIPDKNSKGRVVTEVFEPNFTKLDQNAEVVDRDKNAIWGGLDGGGLIEDPSVTKVVGKRYIGADGKAYICKVPSNINNTTNYTPCNVVDNLNNITNLIKTQKNGNWEIIQFLNIVILRNSLIAIGGNEYGQVDFPINLKDTNYSVSILGGSNALNTINIAYNWETKRNNGFAIKENSGNSASLEIIVIGNI